MVYKIFLYFLVSCAFINTYANNDQFKNVYKQQTTLPYEIFPSLSLDNAFAFAASTVIPTLVWWKFIKSPHFCNTEPLPTRLAALIYAFLTYVHYLSFANFQGSSKDRAIHLGIAHALYSVVYIFNSYGNIDISALLHDNNWAGNNPHVLTSLIFVHIVITMLYLQGIYLGISVVTNQLRG